MMGSNRPLIKATVLRSISSTSELSSVHYVDWHVLIRWALSAEGGGGAYIWLFGFKQHLTIEALDWISIHTIMCERTLKHNAYNEIYPIDYHPVTHMSTTLLPHKKTHLTVSGITWNGVTIDRRHKGLYYKRFTEWPPFAHSLSLTRSLSLSLTLPIWQEKRVT